MRRVQKNHCACVRALASVALLIQHATRMRHVVVYFRQYLINGTIVRRGGGDDDDPY